MNLRYTLLAGAALLAAALAAGLSTTTPEPGFAISEEALAPSGNPPPPVVSPEAPPGRTEAGKAQPR